MAGKAAIDRFVETIWLKFTNRIFEKPARYLSNVVSRWKKMQLVRKQHFCRLGNAVSNKRITRQMPTKKRLGRFCVVSIRRKNEQMPTIKRGLDALMLYQTCEKSSWCQQENEIWAVLCCINQAKKWIDANKNHHCVARDVGIREEICLIDANIGLVLPSHQLEKTRKWYSMVGEEQFRQGTRRSGNGGHT